MAYPPTSIASPSARRHSSSRIDTLRRAQAAGNGAALESFWREVTEHGTPLAEPIPGDERHTLVTFLWRGGGEVRTVVVLGDLAQGDPAGHQLTRLDGTDVWFRSYRLPHGTRTTYRLSPNDSLVPWAEVSDWSARLATAGPDPLNPRRFVFPRDPEIPGSQDHVLSFLELPGAPPQPWITPHLGVPSGRVESHRVPSERLGGERRVWVYTPPGCTRDAPDGAHQDSYPLLVLFDGFEHTGAIPTPIVLANLQAAGRLPPVVAVLVDTRANRARDLNCYPPFDDFVAHELVPWVRERWRVSPDPGRTVIGGYSLGGLAAAYAALRHPGLFGAVLSQSGAFWHGGPGGPGGPQGHDGQADDGEHEWLARLFAGRSPASDGPLRFYLDVGILETKPTDDDGPTFLVANRHLRTVLRARGYPVHYAEFVGGHEQLSWRGSLADALVALLGTTQGTG